MRMVDAAEAVSGIKSGDQVWLHAAASTPSVLLDALVARADELRDVKVVHFHCEGPGPHLAPEMAGHFFHRALFIGPNARAAINEGRAEYIPAFLSDVPTMLRRGLIPLDAALINVSPPDRHGFCSLGTSVIALPTAIRTAKTVIAQINAAVAQMDKNTQQNAAMVEQAAAASESLTDQARDIAELVRFFKVEDSDGQQLERFGVRRAGGANGARA